MRWNEITEQIVTQAAPHPAAGDDIELLEMANLEPSQTGIDGTIYISTQQAGHAPRVKYYAGRPGATRPSLSVTIEPQPEVAVNSLPNRIANKMAPIVQAWVTLNYAKLRDFWFNGNTWYQSEVERFIAGLTKWTPSKPADPGSVVPLPTKSSRRR